MISKSGEVVGKVKEVMMNGFNVEGLIVAKSLSLRSIFIEKTFVKIFNQNEVVLNMNPVTLLEGLSVYDKSGRLLGTVRKVLRANNKNDFTSLIVKEKFYKKAILIEKNKVDIMKKNIILNIDYLEYSKSTNKKEK